MGPTQLLEEIRIYREKFDSAIKLLKEMIRLEQDRVQNMPLLKARLTQLDDLVEQISQSADQLQALPNRIDEYKLDLTNAEE